MLVYPPILVPSILAGKHAQLAESVREIEALGLPWVHLDIMDGHFVPNLSFGPKTVAALRHCSPHLFFDTHLMLDEPQRYIKAFAQAGANLISIHVEPDYPIRSALKDIREAGCQAGIALNPNTTAEAAEPFLTQVDLVLLMTVEPGFGGQPFREDVLPKIATLNRWRTERQAAFRLEVDGGVDIHTAEYCRQHGSDTLVAGTAFFKAKDQASFVNKIIGQSKTR